MRYNEYRHDISLNSVTTNVSCAMQHSNIKQVLHTVDCVFSRSQSQIRNLTHQDFKRLSYYDLCFLFAWGKPGFSFFWCMKYVATCVFIYASCLHVHTFFCWILTCSSYNSLHLHKNWIIYSIEHCVSKVWDSESSCKYVRKF